MTRSLAGLFATALVAVACCQGRAVAPREPSPAGLDELARALALGRSEPAAALAVLERGAVAGSLETVRLELWLDCLERVGAPPGRWHRVLAQRPPSALAARARVGLARALVAGGDRAAAEAVLAGDVGSDGGDRALLELGREPARTAAARRLAVRQPLTLARAVGAAAEATVVASLAPAELVARGRRWLELGQAERAIRELDGRRFVAPDEEARRLVLAGAFIARGQPSRTLAILPERPGLSAEGLVVRAQAERRAGWQLHPEAAAVAAFARCRRAADRALAAALDEPTRRQAARLVVECATESNDPAAGLAAWAELVAHRRPDDDLDWIGRRFGLKLAAAGRRREARSIGRVLPDHERCLAYWSALPASPEREALAAAAVPDVYAGWAAVEQPRPRPPPPLARPPLGDVPPPAPVAWLLAQGARDEAAREWERIRAVRGSTPAEALAAARFEAGRRHANQAIRLLRAAFPELGRIDLLAAPADVVEAYLPLPWPEAVLAAAAESGVEPWVLAGLARQESVFTATARSPRGAVGVLQLLPSTARPHALALGLGAAPDLTDPTVSLRLGARELAVLLAEFGELEPALAAYNAGPTRARRWRREWPDRRRFTEAVPIPETYTYIRRVSFLAAAYREVYAETWGRR